MCSSHQPEIEIQITMKSIFCVVLLIMILHPAECRRYGQQNGYGDEGDYGGPSGGGGGGGGCRHQKGAQGGIMGHLSELTQSLGLPNQLQGGFIEKLLGLGQKFAGDPGKLQEQLFGLAQQFGLSRGQLQDLLSGLVQKFGSVPGSGDGTKCPLKGLAEKFLGKGQRFGSSSGGCGGTRKKFGQGAGSGRNGYGSDYDGEEEESGRGGQYGSQYGGRRGRNSGQRRRQQEPEDY
ncbi:keratin, type I cytoskeletal 9-like isoform X1 [Bufo gargarizans]|uniref:keratin, type I cytoskeletal 9-like isoform X1 n=2 Tax=Bufo gargarizans TaxID=30331 RepID=UPI001CF3FF95|nr:keratin, type I cytoskeletal 9-like isoform X1 [Bufo gargarizans]XP_044125294.1 keratin, type I cytoskeletal 9-like isoform X1 [Bufo gargarizans]XP_044125295.1 keratin, type I cytoskeletal 9-like isoform X1 [Bufo gargarizans]XP_044125296.1 keratin, type I cytoskeletal 9-like isoform X1 [Bufo gargarizans]XP_044125297.1 keratin, type I cytoskeletal 9-like isoform X1 [Bufo gargarizans]